MASRLIVEDVTSATLRAEDCGERVRRRASETPHRERRTRSPRLLLTPRLLRYRYGDALQWAAHYGISADPVRIAQWRDADVSRHSIRDFLHKVSSLQWVLGECCRRLPDDDASMEILLEYVT